MSSFDLAGAAMAACVLPGEIMVEILSILPVKSLLRFRCVCKSWSTLITNPSFIIKHLNQTNLNTNEHLIIHSGRQNSHKYVITLLFHSKETPNSSINLNSPFLGISNYIKIVGSCNGLLCLSLSYLGSNIFLWNPATRQYKNVPEPEISVPQGKRRHSVCLGFGFDPNANDYKVVRFLCYKGLKPSVQPVQKVEVYSKIRDSWREVNVGLQFKVTESSSPTAVVSGGIHWMATGSDYSEVIACFVMGREVFEEMSPPDSYGIGGTDIGKQLAVVKDCLAVVVYPLRGDVNKGIDVWVMKEYGVKESWTKQFRFGTFSGVARPLACFKSGEFIMQNNKDKLFLYDPNTRKFDKLPLCRARYIYDIHTYMESLVSLNNVD